MERLVYDVQDDQARRFFEFAGFRARNLSDPLRRAGTTLLHHIARTFETEGGWIGEPWPELSEGYRVWKEKHFPGRPLLVATGFLQRVAVSRASTRVRGNELVWSIDVPKAAVLQDGATWLTHRKTKDGIETHVARIPPRPFMKVTPELLESIENDFRLWLEELKAVNTSRAASALPNPLD